MQEKVTKGLSSNKTTLTSNFTEIILVDVELRL